MAHSHSENTGQMLGVAAIAAGIGALTALLVTPRTGQEMRKGIGRKARYAKDSMMDKLHSSSDDMSETIDDAKDAATDMKEKAKDKTADVADKTKRKADR